MAHYNNKQLPDEVVAQIKKEADGTLTRASQDLQYSAGYYDGYYMGATEYASKLHQAQQEIESLTNQLKKQNEVQDENMKVLRNENEYMRKECERLSELVFQLSPRRRNSIDDL